MDAHGVVTRGSVSRLERVGEGGHRLAVRVLHQPPLRPLFLDDKAQVSRIREQLVRVLSLGSRPRLAGASEHAVDGVEEVERPEWLSHQRVRAGGAGVGGARLPAGENDDPRRSERPVLFQLPAEGETARARQVHVEHNE